MLTDGQILLRAICADPDDDLPRLVYADWLEENGNPDRAAFIRLQCEFERKLRLNAGFDEDARREEVRLSAAHAKQWLSELPRIPGVTWDTTFHRGFVRRVIVESDTVLLARADEIVGQNPIEYLTIQEFTGAAGVTRLPVFRHLRTAFISVSKTTPSVVAELLAWDQFRPKLVLRLDNFHDMTAHGYQAVLDKFRDRLA